MAVAAADLPDEFGPGGEEGRENRAQCLAPLVDAGEMESGPGGIFHSGDLSVLTLPYPIRSIPLRY